MRTFRFKIYFEGKKVGIRWILANSENEAWMKITETYEDGYDFELVK